MKKLMWYTAYCYMMMILMAHITLTIMLLLAPEVNGYIKWANISVAPAIWVLLVRAAVYCLDKNR